MSQVADVGCSLSTSKPGQDRTGHCPWVLVTEGGRRIGAGRTGETRSGNNGFNIS